MKIGIVGDVHWCTYSSILRQRGEVFSWRLLNLIKSVNFAESKTKDCDFIVYLGDFFDRADITAEELSALRNVIWNEREHFFLVGNHETASSNLFNNTAKVLGMLHFDVISNPWFLEKNGADFLFLPYQNDRERFDLSSISNRGKTIVFSHNDVQMQYGMYHSTVGYAVEDIEKNCRMFINGHIHNFGTVGNKIINVGNLTGQNFCEDGFVYKHKIAFLDTDTMEITYEENPHAINFYKLDLTNGVAPMYGLFGMPDVRACVSATCLEDDVDEVRDYLNKHAVSSRVVLMKKAAKDVADNSQEIRVADHLELFKQYINEKYSIDSEIEKREMSLVVR